jgi:hypothetical protein
MALHISALRSHLQRLNEKGTCFHTTKYTKPFISDNIETSTNLTSFILMTVQFITLRI